MRGDAPFLKGRPQPERVASPGRTFASSESVSLESTWCGGYFLTTCPCRKGSRLQTAATMWVRGQPGPTV